MQIPSNTQCPSCSATKPTVVFMEPKVKGYGVSHICSPCRIKFAVKDFGHMTTGDWRSSWGENSGMHTLGNTQCTKCGCSIPKLHGVKAQICRRCAVVLPKRRSPTVHVRDGVECRECTHCAQILPFDQFYIMRGGFKGRDSRCSACARSKRTAERRMRLLGRGATGDNVKKGA